MNTEFFWKRLARNARRAGNRARDGRRWREAADQYRRYLAVVPDDFAIHVQLGHMLGEAGDTDAAELAYAAAARLSPEDADLLLCWGHLRRRIGDLAGARTLYARSLAVDGNAHAGTALAEAPELEPEPAPPAEPEWAPEPVREPDPIAHEAEPDPEPEPEPEPPFVGEVDLARDRVVTGFVIADTTECMVEFRVGDPSSARRVPPGRGPMPGFISRHCWTWTARRWLPPAGCPTARRSQSRPFC